MDVNELIKQKQRDFIESLIAFLQDYIKEEPKVIKYNNIPEEKVLVKTDYLHPGTKKKKTKKDDTLREITITPTAATDKAVCVMYNGNEVWLPRSQIIGKYTYEEGVPLKIKVTDWIFQKKFVEGS